MWKVVLAIAPQMEYDAVTLCLVTRSSKRFRSQQGDTKANDRQAGSSEGADRLTRRDLSGPIRETDMKSEYDANQALADMLQRFQNTETFRRDFLAELEIELDRARVQNKVLDVIFGEQVK